MDYELIHDIIAKQIFEKASDEARNRRRIEKYIHDRLEAYQQRRAKLTQDDMEYILPYLSEVNLSKDEQRFIENGIKGLRAARRRKQMIEIIIGLILFIAAAISIWFAIQANQKAEIAKAAQIQADSNAEKARLALSISEETEFESRNLARIAQQKALQAQRSERIADSSATIARQNAEQARQAEKVAAQSAEIARQEKKTADSLAIIAQEALANLQSATESVVKSVLADARQDIYTLRYEEALNKFNDAYYLNKLPEEVSQGMIELAFFFNESGERLASSQLIAAVLEIHADPEAKRLFNQIDDFSKLTRSFINSILVMIDPILMDSLWKKYYPQMIHVKGGNFQMGSTKNENESPIHQVRLDDFQMAMMETTVWQYQLYCQSTKQDDMGRIAPSVPWGLNGDNPVVMVSWFDAARYANWVSKQMGLDTVYLFSHNEHPESVAIRHEANGYRLPTEAQWEYAATGGIKGYDTEGKPLYKYAGTTDTASLGTFAWYKHNSGNRARKSSRQNSQSARPV